MSAATEDPLLAPQTKKSKQKYSTGANKDPKTGQIGWMPPLIMDEQRGLTIRHVDARGNLILKLEDAGSGKDLFYLVSEKRLQDASPYFNTLLDTSKFSEGAGLGAKMAKLRKKYRPDDSIPVAELPVISIGDVGAIPAKKSTEVVFTLFLCILHYDVLMWGQPEWTFLAMLAIIADRFDALAIVAEFVRERSWARRSFAWDEKTPLDIKTEEKVREQILVGLLLGNQHLLKRQTAILIVAGSVRWIEGDEFVEARLAMVDLNVLWWDLPQKLEDEMLTRRGSVLQTLSSLQKHSINLYIFEPNQCKYGYDTSPACNSFQLGQMIRFFAIHGTLTIESSFMQDSEAGMMCDNILDLITTLRACPERQVDSNHQHCGIRSRLIAGLELIVPLAQVGICGPCWKESPQAESWQRSPCGAKWLYAPLWQGRLLKGCAVHREAKAMYTAKERDWTFRPS